MSLQEGPELLVQDFAAAISKFRVPNSKFRMGKELTGPDLVGMLLSMPNNDPPSRDATRRDGGHPDTSGSLQGFQGFLKLH